MGSWWEEKWWWVLCILLPLVAGPAVNLFFFPEMPLSRSIVYSLSLSFGVFLAYLAHFGRLGRKQFDALTLRRIIFIMFGAFTAGFLSWALIILPLASYFDIPGPMVLLLLFILMVACAFIVDTIMKRRDYRPLMEGGGNI